MKKLKVSEQAELLRKHRIFNAYDFSRATNSFVVQYIGWDGTTMWTNSYGWSAVKVLHTQTNERGMPYPIIEKIDLDKVISGYSGKLSDKPNVLSFVGKHVGIKEWQTLPVSRNTWVSKALLDALIEKLLAS